MFHEETITVFRTLFFPGERMLFRAGLLSLGEIIGRRPLLFAIPSAVLAVTAIVAFVFAP